MSTRDGSCKDAFGCPIPVAGSRSCTLCGKAYSFCKIHKPWGLQCIQGHVLRTHPETLPDAVIDKLLDDIEAMLVLRKERLHSPDLWEKLFIRLDARKAARTQ